MRCEYCAFSARCFATRAEVASLRSLAPFSARHFALSALTYAFARKTKRRKPPQRETQRP